MGGDIDCFSNRTIFVHDITPVSSCLFSLFGLFSDSSSSLLGDFRLETIAWNFLHLMVLFYKVVIGLATLLFCMLICLEQMVLKVSNQFLNSKNRTGRNLIDLWNSTLTNSKVIRNFWFFQHDSLGQNYAWIHKICIILNQWFWNKNIYA